MKKLERKSLDELAKVMPVISEEYVKKIIGGSGGLLDVTGDVTYINTGSGWITEELDPGYAAWLSGNISGVYDQATNTYIDYLDWLSGTISGSSNDLPKGSIFNQYTQEEFVTMWNAGTWNGGYVQECGYALDACTVVSSSTQIANSLNQSISTLNPNTDFEGYSAYDPQGCFRRCQEMLQNGGGELAGSMIIMTSNNNGRAGAATTNSSSGINAINESLASGTPIIVCVDYKAATTSGDKIGDHFVIIVGSNTTTNADGTKTTSYQFYDPATSNAERGTSVNNVLTIQDGKLVGTFGDHNYTVTSVRLNK